jgi:cell division protein FtsZ
MEESMNSTFFTFDSPKGQSSYIKVIGVGGGGGNAVNHMYNEGIEGVDFIVCNTDMKALNASPVPNKILLGSGLGTGKKPERARKAAQERADDIREAIAHNTKMLFITAGMGGGTGTGAAPVIAEIAKGIDIEDEEGKKILVVAIVTRPFSFEGAPCRAQAEAGIEELRKYVDSIIVINNDKLRSFGNLPMSKAFSMADDVLLTAAKGIAEIITVDAYVNRDFEDVNTVMGNSGTALMGIGNGRGETRALDAITGATTSVLLDDSDIRGAKKVLLYFTYSSDHEMTIDELNEITDYVGNVTGGNSEILWGAGPDESLDDELKVILIATGFEKTKAVPQSPEIFVLEDEPKAEVAVDTQAAPAAAADEPYITQKEPVAEVQDIVENESSCYVTPENVQSVVPEVIAAITPEAVGATVADVVVEPVAAPEPVVFEAAPVAAAVEVEAEPERGNVFVLEMDDDPAAVEAKPAPVAEHVVDAAVEEIHIIDRVETVKAEPEPQAVVVEPVRVAPEPVRSPFEGDNDLKTAADRIRRIHELLRNNPNGAEMVQSMSMGQMSEDDLYHGAHSSQRESSAYTMRPDGRMYKNPFIADQPD